MEPGPETGQRSALLVATSAYNDPDLRQLRAPGHDADQLAEVLRDPRIGGFDVQVLINPVSGEVQEGIEDFCTDRHPGDQLLIYLSCHGVLDSYGRLYYAAANTRRQRLAATAVAAAWLNERLEDCRARRQILVLDCCHSGAFAKGTKGDSGLALQQRFEPHGRGRVVLTASRSTEYSFEGGQASGEGVPSVFTHAIVTGLRTGEADRDRDGLITVTDLYQYVYDSVRAAEPRQTPELWTYGAEGTLLVARSIRGAIIEPEPLPEDLRVTLESPRRRVRETGVAELAELLDAAGPGLALTARQVLERIAEEDQPQVAALARIAVGAPVGAAADQVRRELADRAHQEEQARQEAARREAEEQARREAEEQARREAEEQARREAEEQARREAEEQARREAIHSRAETHSPVGEHATSAATPERHPGEKAPQAPPPQPADRVEPGTDEKTPPAPRPRRVGYAIRRRSVVIAVGALIAVTGLLTAIIIVLVAQPAPPTPPAPPAPHVRWAYITGGLVISSPAVAGSTVYVGSNDRKVYALDAATGDLRWAHTTGNFVFSSPAVAGGIVYVGSWDHKVYALDAATGHLRWTYTTGNTIESSPAVAGGTVYVGSDDHKVYALDAATGHLRWTYTTGGAIDFSSPAVAGGTVYVGSDDHKVYALDAATGHLRWAYTTGNDVRSSPAVAGGIVYVGSWDHKVYALDAGTGHLRWAYTTGNYVYSSPAVAGGIVYVGSWDHKVYALDAGTGHLRWAYTTGGRVGVSPAVAGGTVYVGSDDHKAYALDAVTGHLRWAYTTGNTIGSSPAVAGGTIYVGSDDHKVYALNDGS
jgi:outer membrane protein assembly factor BamB